MVEEYVKDYGETAKALDLPHIAINIDKADKL